MLSLKGLNNDTGLGRLITVRPLFLITLLGLGVYIVIALTGVKKKRPCYGTCIYNLANIYESNGMHSLQCGRNKHGWSQPTRGHYSY